MVALVQYHTSDEEDEHVKVPLQTNVTSQLPPKSETEKSSMTSLAVPPDGGWGWVVCGAAFMCMVALDGMLFSFGVFFLELLDHFGEGKGKTAMVGSVLMGTHLMLGPLTSSMVNSWGIRPVAFTGALIAGTAFAISTLAPSVTVLILTYGVIAGVGVSMLYIPSLLAVGFYFEKRRALANGITASGSGIGAFIYSPLSTYLQDHYGWNGALLILSGVVLNCAVCGALYRPLEARRKRAKKPPAKVYEGEEIVGPDPRYSMEKLNGVGVKDMDFHRQILLKQSHLYGGVKSQSLNEISHKNTAIRGYDAYDETSSNYSLEVYKPNNRYEVPSEYQYVNSTPVCVNGPSDSRRPNYAKLMLNFDTSASSDNVFTRLKRHHVRHGPPAPRPLVRQDLFYSGSLHRIPQYRDNPSIRSLAFREDEEDVTSVTSPSGSNVCNFLDRKVGIRLLVNPVFLITMFSMVLWTTHSTVLTILPDYAGTTGSSETQGAMLLSIIGATNTAGRIFAGWLSDRPDVDVVKVNMAALITGSLTCFTIPFTSNYIVMACQAGVFGLCMATWTSLRPIVLVELLGVSKLTNAFGLVAMFQGIAFCVGPPLAGVIFDKTQSYKLPFMLVSGAYLVSAGLCLCMRRVARWHARRSGQTNVVIDAKEIGMDC